MPSSTGDPEGGRVSASVASKCNMVTERDTRSGSVDTITTYYLVRHDLSVCVRILTCDFSDASSSQDLMLRLVVAHQQCPESFPDILLFDDCRYSIRAGKPATFVLQDVAEVDQSAHIGLSVSEYDSSGETRTSRLTSISGPSGSERNHSGRLPIVKLKTEVFSELVTLGLSCAIHMSRNSDSD